MEINTAKVTIDDIKIAPTSELVATYNKITGKSIKKFADRAAAERQTWKAIGMLAPNENINEPAKPEEPSKPMGKRESYESRTIKLLIDKNPKRAGTMAHKAFELLMKMEGKTYKEYKANEGKHPDLDKVKGWAATEIRWSIKSGYIKLEK